MSLSDNVNITSPMARRLPCILSTSNSERYAYYDQQTTLSPHQSSKNIRNSFTTSIKNKPKYFRITLASSKFPMSYTSRNTPFDNASPISFIKKGNVNSNFESSSPRTDSMVIHHREYANPFRNAVVSGRLTTHKLLEGCAGGSSDCSTRI